MRKSRVLLAGVAVAAAAATTTAFTGSNTLPDKVLGYGVSKASGAVVDSITYTHAAGTTTVTAVVFTTSSHIAGETATMQLQKKDTVTPFAEQNVGSAYTCTITPATDAPPFTITCDTSASTLDFADFDLVGLTVAP